MDSRQALLSGLLAAALVGTAVTTSLYVGEKARTDEAVAAYAKPRADTFVAWAREFESASAPLQGISLAHEPPEEIGLRLRLVMVQLHDAQHLTALLFNAEAPGVTEAARALRDNLTNLTTTVYAMSDLLRSGETLDPRQDAILADLPDGLATLAGLARSHARHATSLEAEGRLVPYAEVMSAEDWALMNTRVRQMLEAEP